MNATHALNIAIRSLAHKGTRVLVSGYEHNSVTRPLAQLGADIAVASSAPFDRNGILKAFRDKIPAAELVVCTHVSNVFGFILPVYEIAEMCRRAGVPFILDASQSAGVLEVDYQALGAAFIAMPGHKALFGPQGTGILICGVEGEPLLSGGSGSDSIPQLMPEYLPDRMEAGTHNVPGIAGLSEGISYVRSRGLKSIAAHEGRMLDTMLDGLNGCAGLEIFRGAPGTPERCTVVQAASRRLRDSCAAALRARHMCAQRAALRAVCAQERRNAGNRDDKSELLTVHGRGVCEKKLRCLKRIVTVKCLLLLPFFRICFIIQ